jgi:uncharacterized protein (DUF427 family)
LGSFLLGSTGALAAASFPLPSKQEDLPSERPKEHAVTDTRPRLQPSPDHPITIEPNDGHVTVRQGSSTIAETNRALRLHEASYPPVLYIPIDDVDQRLLQASHEHTYCPYKGEASYYDIVAGDAETSVGTVWFYPEPYDAVDAIRDHVAFYADRVTITNES